MVVKSLSAPAARRDTPSSSSPDESVALQELGRLVGSDQLRARRANAVPPGYRTVPVPGGTSLPPGTTVSLSPPGANGLAPYVVSFYATLPGEGVFGPFEAVTKASLRGYDLGEVSVVSDEPLSFAQADSYAAELKQAWRFDQQQAGGSVSRDLTAEPLTLRVLSKPLMEQWYPGGAGTAEGTGALNISPQSPAQRAGIFSHELSHIQGARDGGYLTHALDEGRAGVLQRLYLQQQGLPFDEGDRRYAATVTAQATATNLETWNPADQWRDAFAGVMFCEFLRSRLRGTGVPDAMRRIERMVQEVCASGPRPEAAVVPDQAISAAFQREFGLPYEDAKQEFLRYLQDTEGHPEERLRGTLFEPPARP